MCPQIYLGLNPNNHTITFTMKVGMPKIKVVVGKLQIQDLPKFGKVYKGFLSILNWGDL
jgi:hypothetical protein